MPASLHVWMNGRHVGVWTHSPGTSSFQYDPVWAAAPDRRRLSLSLDFQPGNAARKGAVVESYFDNLLPDSETIRKRLQSRFGTASREPFYLLAAIGRDCIGAVQLLPAGEEPAAVEKIKAVPLDDAEVEQAISAALSDGRGLGQADDEDFRRFAAACG